MRRSRHSRNWTSLSLPSALAWHGHEVVYLAVGRLALQCAEENPDEVVFLARPRGDSADNPPHDECDQYGAADVPGAQLADAIVRQVLPEPVPIDHGLLEQHPRIEEREPDREHYDTWRLGRRALLRHHPLRKGWTRGSLRAQVDLKSRGNTRWRLRSAGWRS